METKVLDPTELFILKTFFGRLKWKSVVILISVFERLQFEEWIGKRESNSKIKIRRKIRWELKVYFTKIRKSEKKLIGQINYWFVEETNRSKGEASKCDNKRTNKKDNLSEETVWSRHKGKKSSSGHVCAGRSLQNKPWKTYRLLFRTSRWSVASVKSESCEKVRAKIEVSIAKKTDCNPHLHHFGIDCN